MRILKIFILELILLIPSIKGSQKEEHLIIPTRLTGRDLKPSNFPPSPRSQQKNDHDLDEIDLQEERCSWQSMLGFFCYLPCCCKQTIYIPIIVTTEKGQD